jgi:hypothetical protein
MSTTIKFGERMKIRFFKPVLLILFAIISLSAFAQSYRFGKVSKEQWNIKSCPFDTLAEAMVLFDEGDFRYEFHEILSNESRRTGEQPFDISFNRHIRIKILKNSCDSVSLISIPTYIYPEKKRSLNSFKAILLRKDGKRLKKQKFKRKDLIEAKDEYGLVYKLFFKEISAGSIIDIEYLYTSNYLFNIPDWSFCNKFPIIYSKISYTIPQFMDITKDIEIFEQLEKSTTHFTSQKQVTMNFATAEYYPFNFNVETYELRNIKGRSIQCDSHIFRCYVRALNLGTISNNPEPVRIYYYSSPPPPVNR